MILRLIRMNSSLQSQLIPTLSSSVTPTIRLAVLSHRISSKQFLTHCKETNTYVMIDETYIEFVPDVDELSAIPLTELFDNVIILRGTSKFFATPGLRLGYAITSNSQILTDINTNKNPWMINSLAVVAGETMFLDEEYIDKTRSLILSEKTRCRQLIEESHKFKLYPSYSNFYLLKTT